MNQFVRLRFGSQIKRLKEIKAVFTLDDNSLSLDNLRNLTKHFLFQIIYYNNKR